LGAHPDDAEARLRYSAVLFAAGDCERARSNAERALQARPRSEVGTLIVGQCLEGEGRFDEAISTYRRYTSSFPDERGADAVRARTVLAAEAQARALARQAIQHEADIAAQADADALGVLPFAVSGDEDLRPLSLGLANILTTDLGLIRRFRLVERVRLAAVLDELELARSGRVDPATAARLGRLTGAGRLVQGSLVEGEGGSLDLSAAVALSSGEILEPNRQRGDLERLLQLEKQLVIDIAGELGYQLTGAERQRVLENGTKSLTAFLAFSRGLEAEDRGDYAEAARWYGEAVDADPRFTEAREKRRTVTAMRVVAGSAAGDVTTVGDAVASAIGALAGSAAGSLRGTALTSAVVDVAGTQGERATGGGSQPRIDDVNRPDGPTLPHLIAIIRIVVTIPLGGGP
jgi:tetratricopeptide (TPR) repeat protein